MSVSSEIHQLWGLSFSLKCSKLNLNLGNAKRKSEIIFPFWDNCIWKCCNKLPLLRREYLSSAVNELTNSPNMLHITQGDFFNLNCFQREQWIFYMCFCSDFNSASARLPCYLSNDPLKLDFLDIYITTFFGDFIGSKIHQLWGSSFFWKCSKLNLNLENVKKNWENIFRFWDKCIWKCCNKLLLLRA